MPVSVSAIGFYVSLLECSSNSILSLESLIGFFSSADSAMLKCINVSLGKYSHRPGRAFFLGLLLAPPPLEQRGVDKRDQGQVNSPCISSSIIIRLLFLLS